MNKVNGARAFLRAKYGVYREVDVYRRGEHLYVPHGKGFLRIMQMWAGKWATSHPQVDVIELEGVS